jgi:hypothetical protein
VNLTEPDHGSTSLTQVMREFLYMMQMDFEIRVLIFNGDLKCVPLLQNSGNKRC